MTLEEARIDKWLWAVRIYKTRSLAAEACKKGKVSINDTSAKPSRMVRKNDKVTVKKPPVTHTFSVKELSENRMGAKLVGDYLVDLTPKEEIDKLNANSGNSFFFFERGKGRPTKKDRRDIEDFLTD